MYHHVFFRLIRWSINMCHLQSSEKQFFPFSYTCVMHSIHHKDCGPCCWRGREAGQEGPFWPKVTGMFVWSLSIKRSLKNTHSTWILECDASCSRGLSLPLLPALLGLQLSLGVQQGHFKPKRSELKEGQKQDQTYIKSICLSIWVCLYEKDKQFATATCRFGLSGVHRLWIRLTYITSYSISSTYFRLHCSKKFKGGLRFCVVVT